MIVTRRRPRPLSSVLFAMAIASMLVAPLHASLIFDSNVDASGSGLGAVATILTVHETGGGGDGMESGCVAWNGAADVVGNAVCQDGLAGGDESTGSSQTLTRPISEFLPELATLGDLALVVNITEPGQLDPIDLTKLYIEIFDAGGTQQFFASLAAPITLQAGTGTGLGSSGFVFRLDPAMTAAANLVNGGVLDPTWRVGGGAEFEDFSGGNEAVQVLDIGIGPVPEPTSITLLGLGLLAMGVWRRKRKG